MNNEELDALITRLKELEDPQKEAFPSFADTDWRTTSGVVAREIESLRQQLSDHIKREVMLREFVQKIKEQTPEKPDYWSSCSQCEHNSSEAEDILEALVVTEPKPWPS